MARGGKFTRDMGNRFGRRSAAWRSESDVGRRIKGLHGPQSAGPRLAGDGSANIRVSVGKQLSQGERGAVWPSMPPEAFPGPDQLVSHNVPIPHEEIRSAILFFDRFDVPKYNGIALPAWCDDEFSRVGILTSSEVSAESVVASAMRNFPFSTFQAREQLEPGMWTLARPAQSVGFPAKALTPGSAISLTLHNALPTFTRDVDLEDVLEFKNRNWSELLALRAHINECGDELVRNGTNDFANSASFKRFTKSLEDHITVMNQSNRDRTLVSIRQSWNTGEAISGAAGMAVEAAVSGQFPFATIAAAAVGYTVKVVGGLKRKSTGPNPFEYLTSAQEKLF